MNTRSKYFAVMMAATACSMAASNTAQAQSLNDETNKNLAPIIMFVLDTSGSMCDGADGTVTEGADRCDSYPPKDRAFTSRFTKLTKAISDLTGKPRMADNAIGTGKVSLPRSHWECNDTAKECRFEKTLGEFTGVGLINESLVNKTTMNYEPAYFQDGILQRYQNKAKFGFAGMANGTTNAVVDDPSKRVVDALGGDTDVALRFTIVWNEDSGSHNNRDDNDLHVQEWHFVPDPAIPTTDPDYEDKVWQAYLDGKGSYEAKGHVYYAGYRGSSQSSASPLGGLLDVDKCVGACSSNNSSGCPRPAAENIQYKYNTKMTPGDKFYYYIHQYNNCSDVSDGFEATTSLGGCAIYKITYHDSYASFPAHCQSSFSYNDKLYRYCNNVSYCSSSNRCLEIGVATYKGHGEFEYQFLFKNELGVPKSNKYTSEVTAGNELSDPKVIHMYGYHPFTRSDGVTVGLNLKNKDYKKQKDCTQDFGMWDSDVNTKAPLFYPTVSDDADMIVKSNQALIEMVRSYQATAATPIGEVLADLYYMFGGLDANDKNKHWQPTPIDLDRGRGDPGLFLQKLNYTDSQPAMDERYKCREKAVIFVTDGKPVGSGIKATNTPADENKHGFQDNVWIDANHLRQIGVNVYVVAYGTDFKPEDFDTLDRVAFYGGTCNNPDTLKLFDPDNDSDDAAFKAMIAKNRCVEANKCIDKCTSGELANCTTDKDKDAKCGRHVKDGSCLDDYAKHCFYDAQDSSGNALAKAVDSIISKILVASVSKTRVATTTAIGVKKNYDTSTKKYTNGYYSVYSGYESTLGQIRNTKLQRVATTCHPDATIVKNVNGTNVTLKGVFLPDETQYSDMSLRLNLRTNTDYYKVKQTEIKDGVEVETGLYEIRQVDRNDANLFPDSSDPIRSGTLCAENDPTVVDSSSIMANNTCLNNRYIFAGDYYSATTNPSYGTDPRYRIRPDNVALTTKSGTHYIAGSFKNGKAGGDYHFLEEHVDGDKTCAKVQAQPLSVNFKSPNYLLSPYQCINDYDCAVDGTGKSQRCDIGRCVRNDEYAKLETCDKAMDDGNRVCIAGRLRPLYKGTFACTKHADCSTDEYGSNVCHAGKCVPGTVLQCDLRQFIASQPLGTIEYASPVVVNPPRRNYKSSSYRAFSKNYYLRDTMLLVGANDGMLHNFILGKNNDITYKTDGDVDNNIKAPAVALDLAEGDELWGFIPKSVMHNLYKLPSFGAQSHVNATPYVADVQDPGETDLEKSWKTVVVGGFRDGGRGYYAMDITDPGKPKILWEIDNQWQPKAHGTGYSQYFVYPDMAGNTGSVTSLEEEDYFPFLRMGNSYPEPIITNIPIITDSGTTIEPVAILAGGMNDNETVDAKDYTGKALYIVRLFPRTPGELLVKRYSFSNRVTGSPAVYPSNFNSIGRLIYVGDSTGALYRIDLRQGLRASSEPREIDVSTDYNKFDSEGNLEPIFKPSDIAFSGDVYERMTYRPAVAAYSSDGLDSIIQVSFATGSNDNFNITTADKNYAANFYDFLDGNHYTLAKSNSPRSQVLLFSQSATGTVDKSWKTDSGTEHYFTVYQTEPVATDSTIDQKQKVTGAPLIYNYIAYYPTFISDPASENVCSIDGRAAIWKLNGGNATHIAYSPSMVQNTTIGGDDPFFDGTKQRSMFKLGVNTRIYGLEITPQLFCSDGTGGGTTLAPQLVALTSTEFSNDAGAQAGTTELKPRNTDVAAFAMNLDAIKPDTHPVSWASVYE